VADIERAPDGSGDPNQADRGAGGRALIKRHLT
jgi:hypothetical protein